MEKKPPAKAAKKDSAKKTDDDKKDFLVVGLGASAGGVKALQEFFATMPPNSGMAFVVILHLDPHHESNLAGIIQAQTPMPVVQVNQTEKVTPNRVYVIPPNVQLEMVDGVVRPAELEKARGRRAAIDIFFRTLADAYERNSVCVVLSGTGADGTQGLKRIKEANGFAVVQSPDEAEYDSMPRSAISTQLADWILPVRQMPEKLIGFKSSSERLHLTDPDADAKKVAAQINADESLREILTLLRVRTGHDFSNYKKPTLVRRVARHLQIHELEDIPAYLEYLRKEPNEIQSLLKNLLINVTNFFRDKAAFEALQAEVLPKIFEGKSARDTVRVWSCGCASGEEAYSLAMILQEHAETLPDPPKFQVFASDVDDEAISEAREHRYPETIEADVSPERLKRFFVKEGAYYRVKKELREAVLFAPHNVLRDPPFSRLDLVACRNLMIYLNRETQERVLQIFHFALNNQGYLFLGSSETAESRPLMFAPVDKKQRIYSRRLVPIGQNFVPMMPVAGRWEVSLPDRRRTEKINRAATLSEIHYKLLENYAPSSILVNQDFDIVYLSQTAGKFLRFASGEPSRNLLRAVNPDLLPDLRAALFTAQRERQPAEFPNVRVRLDGAETTVNVIVRTVDLKDEASDFLLVIFEERSSPSSLKAVDDDIERSHDKDEAMETVVRRLEEDLQRTKEHLRFTIEQHETTVEELKASNEELQAINEELRSASEELETSKEELQSVNEELTTVNHELKDKIDETVRVNSDLSNLMAATDIATIFLDKNLRIKRYTPPVEEFFNLTRLDIGRPLEHFTHKLNYDRLEQDARRVLKTLAAFETEITDQKNRHFIARFVPYRTADDRIDGVVLNFLNVTDSKQASERLRESEEKFTAFVNATSDVVYEMSADWREMRFLDGKEFIPTTEITRGDWTDIYIPEPERPRVWAAIEKAVQKKSVFELEHQVFRADGEIGWTFSRAIPLLNENGEILKWFGAASDITERKRIAEVLHKSEEKYRTLFDSIDEGYALIEVIFDRADAPVDFRYLETNPVFERLTGLENPSGKLASEIIPDTENSWLKIYGAVAQTGDALRFENYHEPTTRWYSVHASRVGAWGSRQVACVFDDITERKNRERQQEFLLKLSDALRPLTGADEIQRVAAAMVGEFLGVAGANYARLETENGIEYYVARGSFAAPGRQTVDGRYSLTDFPGVTGELRGGQTIIVSDVAADRRLKAKDKASYHAANIAAFVMSPLVKDKRLTAIFAVHEAAPRVWTDAELALLEEIAERTWAAVERARAEEKVRESEARLHSIADLVPDLLWDSEPDGSTNWYNRRWLEYTGQSLEEAIGWGWMDAIHPDDREASARGYREAVENGELLRQEHRIRRYDGEYRWFVVNAFPLKDESGSVVKIYGAATDIHESRLMNEALRESEERYRSLVEASKAAVWILDGEGRAVSEMPQWGEFVGMTFDEYKDFGYADATHPDDRARVMAAWENSLAERVPLEQEFRLRHRDGGYHQVSVRAVPVLDGDGRVHEWVGTVADIQAKHEAEQASRESEDLLQNLVKNLPGGAVFIVDRDLRYLVAEGEALAAAGFKPAELIGRTVAETMPPEVAPDYESLYRRGLAGEAFNREHAAHGRVFVSRGVPLKNAGGETYAVLAISYDITERKSTEEALRESEERLRLATEAAEMYSWEYDIKAKTYKFSKNAPKILGIAKRELPRTIENSFERVHPDDKKLIEKTLKTAIRKGEGFTLDFRSLTRAGEIVWLAVQSVIVKDEKGKPARVLGIAQNITERKTAEERLRESEERMRIAIEAAELATWEWEIPAEQVFWNEQHFKLFGMKPTPEKALRPEDFFYHVHPDDRERVAARLQTAVAKKIPFAAEFCAVIEGDGTRWMSGYGRVIETDKDGKATRMSGVMFDITERKRAEESLRKSEEQLQMILESTKDYAIVTFDLTGIITRWNAGAERIFGYPEGEMIGKSSDLLFTPEDRAADVPAREMQTALKKGRAEDERWHLRKDGSRFFASGVMQPLKDGKIEGFVKIARDQTGKLKSETLLREQEMLRQFVRTQEDERRRVARDLHDHLGQQMTAMRLKLESLKKATKNYPLYADIDEVQNIAEQLDRDVDFLAWELRPAALDDLGLRVTLANFVKQWSDYSGINAEFHLIGLGRSRLDFEIETNLYRIAQEALNNIYKHARATNVSVLLEKRGKIVSLIVEDDGIGFNVAAKSNRRQGLGLVGMNERAKICGGTLEIESKKGGGTTIFARIPVK